MKSWFFISFLTFSILIQGCGSHEAEIPTSLDHFENLRILNWEENRNPFSFQEELLPKGTDLTSINFSPTHTTNPKLISDALELLSENFNKSKIRRQFDFKLSDYCLQLYPFMNEKAEYSFYVNAYCLNYGHTCSDEITQTKDGGECYFTAKIVVSYKSATIIFNGEA